MNGRPDSPDPLLGELLDGRYEIRRRAGTGGMGAIYRAYDRRLDAEVAVKVALDRTSTRRARFAREAESLARIDHPNVVRHLGSGTIPGGRPYLVMEWLEGQNLTARLDDARKLSVDDAVALGAQVADALVAIHGIGVVHRDIKPDNLFLCGGDVRALKVLDLGSALKTTRRRRLTRSGQLLGTPLYMAPEQARGLKSLGPAVDIFALGAVLFECLTGQRPFRAANLLAVLSKIVFQDAPRVGACVAAVPAELEALVAAMLARRPVSRPTAAEVLATLQHVAREPPPPLLLPPPAAAIQLAERRITTVVVLWAEAGAEQTLDAPARDDAFRLARGLATQRLGFCERLFDGSVLVAMASSAPLVDTAQHAAEIALALRGAFPHRALGVVTGRRRPGLAGTASGLFDALPDASPAPPGVVLLDDVTAQLLEARYECRAGPHGPELVGRRAGAWPKRRLLGRESPCVGRARELAMLTATVQSCLEESVAGVLLVTGAPGSGKSRLLEEALHRVDAQARQRAMPPPLILLGRAEEVSAGTFLAVLATALRAPIGPGASDQAIVARLGRRLKSTETAPTVALLGEIVGIQPEAALGLSRLDPVQHGELLRAAFVSWLEAELEEGPVILVLDDLQWADKGTTAAVDQAMARLAGRPLIVLAAARPELDTRFPGLWARHGLQRIHLSRLSDRAVAELVRQALGADVPRETVDWIAARAEGNALALEELIRGAAKTGGRVPPTLPTTVLGMVQKRLDALGGPARLVLRAASVLGEVFDADALAALLPSSCERLLADCLAELQQQELAHPTPQEGARTYAFEHALVREAVYDLLGESDRRNAHGLAAEWLSGRPGASPVAQAHHWVAGGQPHRAVGSFLLAARQALEANDFDAAREHVAAAIAHGAAGEVLGRALVLRSHALRWQGENQAAVASAEQALVQLEEGSPEWFQAVGELCVTYDRTRATAELLAQVARLQRAAPTGSAPDEPEGEPERVAALARCLIPLATNGFLAEAGALADQLRARSESLPAIQPTVTAQLSEGLAAFAMTTGKLGEMIEHTRRAVEAWERTPNRRDLCSSLAYHGLALAYAGFADEGLVAANRAVATADALSSPSLLAWVWSCQGAAYRANRQYLEARAILRRSADLYRIQRNARQEYFARFHCTLACLGAGEWVEAQAEIARLAALPFGFEGGVRALGARVLLELGHTDAALKAARAARHERLAPVPALVVHARLALAYVLALGGERQAADEQWEQALQVLHQLLIHLPPHHSARYVESELGGLLAEVAAALGASLDLPP